MAATDTDLGSGGVTLLPPQTGSSTPNLLVASGKDADIYLVNRDNLGQYNATNNNQITQYIPAALGGELFGTPVYWNNTLYFLAHQDYLKAYGLSVTNGVSALSTTPIAQTASKLTNVGFPVISANGTTNGIVWVVRAVKGVPLMSAYDAGRLFLMYDSGMAAEVATHWDRSGTRLRPSWPMAKSTWGPRLSWSPMGSFPRSIPLPATTRPATQERLCRFHHSRRQQSLHWHSDSGRP